MTTKGTLSTVLALAAAIGVVALTAPGCGGGCAPGNGSPDLSGDWHGGCGADTHCQVVDDGGSLTANCPGFGSCHGSACGTDASLDCTSSLDGSEFSGNLKVSADGNTITGTLQSSDGTNCDLIFEREGKR